MQKSKEREYPIPFHNDVFFKYMLIGEDAGSAMLRSRIIEEIYGLKVQKTQVLNPELLPEAFFGKRAVLDVVLEDETGHLYDLECRYPVIRRRNSCVFSSMATAWLADS